MTAKSSRPSRTPPASPAGDAPVSNLVVLRGTLTSEPTRRELAAGSAVVQFDVSTAVVDGARVANVSVPVAWHDPSAAALSPLAVGHDVVVIGTVRRRFFRVGGATQSRTEVVASRVVPARRTKTVRSLLAAAAACLIDGPPRPT